MKVMLAVSQLDKQSGKERDCLAIARQLVERGHDVTIVTSALHSEGGGEFTMVAAPRRGLTNHTRARNFARAVWDRRRQDRPDVLLSFDLIPGADLHYVADGAAILRDRLLPWPPRQRIRLALERGVFAKPSRTLLLFLSAQQRDEYLVAYDFAPGRSVVLPPQPAALFAAVAEQIEQTAAPH